MLLFLPQEISGRIGEFRAHRQMCADLVRVRLVFGEIWSGIAMPKTAGMMVKALIFGRKGEGLGGFPEKA